MEERLGEDSRGLVKVIYWKFIIYLLYILNCHKQYIPYK